MKNKLLKFMILFLAGTMIDYIIFIGVFSKLPDFITSWLFDSTIISVIVYFWLFLGIPGLFAHYFTFQNIKKDESDVNNIPSTTHLRTSILMSILMGFLLFGLFYGLAKPQFLPYTLHSIDPGELTDPAEFKMKDVQALALSEDFNTRSQNIFDKELENMSCIAPIGGISSAFEKLNLLFPDSVLVPYIREMEDYPFFGNSQAVYLHRVCKTDERYLMLVSSHRNDVRTSGGLKSASLAYSNNNGELVVVEDTHGCFDIIGSSQNFIYLRCGYGDESGGWGAISKVKIGEKKMTNIVKCVTTVGNTDTKQKCYNGKNILYYFKSYLHVDG